MLGRFSQHYRRAGARGVLRALHAKVVRRPLELAVRVPGSPHRLSVRLRSSDLWTFDEIFDRREYDLPLPPEPRTIIDAGANIGLAAVYFAIRFPGARILALEPEARNYDLLCRNVAPYPHVEPLRAALWHEASTLDLTDPGEGEWAYRAGGDAPAGAVLTRVPAFSVADLMRDRGWDRIDVLKVDIEGAEREVFAHAAAWVDDVDAIIVELHEAIAPGCGAAFREATAGFAHRWEHGENVVVGRADHPWPRTP